MAELFADLAERLIAVLYRIVDLLRIVQDHVAHPDFKGSYSMKAVAPVVAPDLTYSDLDIADGGDASAAFYRIVADPTLSPKARDGLRQSLLKYCARDTLALARRETLAKAAEAGLTVTDFHTLAADFAHHNVEHQEEARRSAAEQRQHRVRDLIDHHIADEDNRSWISRILHSLRPLIRTTKTQTTSCT